MRAEAGVNSPLFTRRTTLEEDVHFRLLEFAQMEGDDSVLIIREHRERKTKRSLAELVHSLEPFLLPNQQRIVDADFLGVFLHVFAEIDRDANELETLISMLLLDFFSSGISRRQGAHQVAQKLTIIDLPGQLRIERGSPSRSAA